MSNETILTVVGNLTADPELKFTPSGAAVANFTIASTPRTFNKTSNEWEDGEALFFRCAVWRQMAENVAESLQKGQRVVVTGALRIRQFERQDGSKGTSVEINVDEVAPSLRYATAKVTKVERATGGSRNSQQQAAGSDPWSSAPSADPWSTATQPGGSDEPPF